MIWTAQDLTNAKTEQCHWCLEDRKVTVHVSGATSDLSLLEVGTCCLAEVLEETEGAEVIDPNTFEAVQREREARR